MNRLGVAVVIIGLCSFVTSLPGSIKIDLSDPSVRVDSVLDTPSGAKPLHIETSLKSDAQSILIESPTLNLTKWGGCGWLGRPCFKIEYVDKNQVPQVITVDKIPSIVIGSSSD